MSDIIERLESLYDMASDHSDCIWKEAADEIDSLRQRVKELEHELWTSEIGKMKEQLSAMTKERDDWKYERDMMWDAGTAEEFEYIELRKKLTACERERDHLKFLYDELEKISNGFYDKLCVSQHYAQQLREALEEISDIDPDDGTAWFHEKADAALSLPHDTSALDAMVKDAERYRKLRSMHWSDGGLCVTNAYAVKLGHTCPSEDRLDAAIDAAMEGKE